MTAEAAQAEGSAQEGRAGLPEPRSPETGRAARSREGHESHGPELRVGGDSEGVQARPVSGDLK